jgi:hypothetical protein
MTSDQSVIVGPKAWAPRASGGKCSICGMPLGRRFRPDGSLIGYFHINIDLDAYHRRRFGAWQPWTLTPAAEEIAGG